jgi:hypothetical protein
MSEALADKSIQVRVVEWDGHGYTYYDWQRKTINDGHTVQAAVQEVYKNFPQYCVRVESRQTRARRGVDVFKCMADRKYRWVDDVYNKVMEGDEVEISLNTSQPGGPKMRYDDDEVLGEYEIAEAAGADKPGGPESSKPLAALLQRLGDLR